MSRPNWALYALVTAAGTLAGAAVLTVAAAVHRYKQRRAWKAVRSL